MHSPPAEWVLGIGHLAILDYLRDRGEPDGDTLTEVVRSLFATETPRGRALLAGTMTAGGVLLYRHFVKVEMR